ncbi:MAG: AAA family ATPase, partial [Candidatus Omnitrophica bacterium]|nr:AAA family ATPase [Candidatus Omnitrophota bacterium]
SYVLAQDLGCGVLTGVFGCGKTLVGRVMLKDLGADRYSCAFITNPAVSEPVEFLRSIVRGLSPQQLPEKKTELLADSLLEKLSGILVDNVRDGKKNIVIIDEAHTIEDVRMFDQMRLLLNFQLEDKFLLTLFIIGQPELRDKILANKPLDQRVAIRCNLGALSEEDVEKYILHRLRVAGRPEGQAPIFEKDSIKAITQFSGGIPRRINTVSDLSLMTGFARKADKIQASLVQEVVKDFNLT